MPKLGKKKYAYTPAYERAKGAGKKKKKKKR
jgi:hypothetical protein